MLLLAKKRSALTAMHEIMREGNSDKRYFTLVLGQWKNAKQHVKLPLHKFDTPQGEKRVMVREDGQASHTIFTLQKSWPEFSLLEAQLKTGRTHQIRVHLVASRLSHRGRRQIRRLCAQQGIDEAGAEAHVPACTRIAFDHPLTGEPLRLIAPLPKELESFIAKLDGLAA